MVEIIVASSMMVILFFSVSGFLNQSLKMAIDDTHKAEALSLATSVLEQARAFRDENQLTPTADSKLGWTNLNALTRGVAYHFTESGVGPYKWGVAAGSGTSGRFTISFNISNVQRASLGKGDIVSSGGTNDINTLKITSIVSWTDSSGVQTISLYEYLTNFK